MVSVFFFSHLAPRQYAFLKPLNSAFPRFKMSESAAKLASKHKSFQSCPPSLLVAQSYCTCRPPPSPFNPVNTRSLSLFRGLASRKSS